MKYKINKEVLLEEALTQKQQEIYGSNANLENIAAITQGVPGIGGIAGTAAQMHGGYQVGNKLDHSLAGALMGREGALGAASADGREENKNITVGDAYSQGNALRRGIGGASTGAAIGYMAGGSDENKAALAAGGALVGGATTALLTPALRYGMGRMFGKKNLAPSTVQPVQ